MINRHFGLLTSFSNLNNLMYLKPVRLKSQRIYSVSKLIKHDSHTSSVTSPYDDMLNLKREEAFKSVLVQVANEADVPELAKQCEKYGKIQRIFHYTSGKNMEKEFVLIEFETKDAVAGLCSEAQFESHSVLVKSRIFIYNVFNKIKTKNKQLKENSEQPFNIETSSTKECSAILQDMQTCASMSEQMNVLHDNIKLTELGSRLRFFVCSQIEDALRGNINGTHVYPFGSSINGFGKYNCDLDMVIGMQEPINKKLTENYLSFQTKKALPNERTQVQRHLEIYGETLQSFCVGCYNIQRILQARVPIIKFKHEFTNLECDLTVGNLSAYYMSELLYLYGELDARVRPLVFTVLRWAKEKTITHENPGRWLTNFNLILMVIFFLQNSAVPVLPPFKQLKGLAGASDVRISEGVEFTFIRDKKNIKLLDNTDDLGSLLVNFFDFFGTFDYQLKGMCIIMGKIYAKPIHDPLYIRNPMEPELNVSKNVSYDEVDRFRIACQNALWNLETSTARPDTPSKSSWGVAKLFEDIKSKPDSKVLLEVKRLFSEEVKSNTATNSNNAVRAVSQGNKNGAVKKTDMEYKRTTYSENGKNRTKSNSGKRVRQFPKINSRWLLNPDQWKNW